MTKRQSVFELLEGRRMLSASVHNGTLKIVGDDDVANTITVSLNADGTTYTATVNDASSTFAAADVKRLSVRGKNQADTITVDPSVKVKADIRGGDGDDVISAQAKAATITGGGGNDSILGSPKADSISGGSGNDTIDAGAGDDKVTGGTGDDSIAGGAGDNSIQGNDGNDTLVGGDDDDLLVGGDGTDSLDGGLGDNTLVEDNPGHVHFPQQHHHGHGQGHNEDHGGGEDQNFSVGRNNGRGGRR